MSSEINFACFLANPNIRTAVKSHVKEIKWNSQIANSLIDYFTNDIVINSQIQPIQIRAFLLNICLPEEVDTLVERCGEAIDLGGNVASLLADFDKFYKTRKVTQILESSKIDGRLDVDAIVNSIATIKSIDDNNTPIDTLGELDIDAVMEEELGGNGILPTQFDFVRRATPFQGYLRGQVIQVVAPPGTGKSNFLANEAVNMLRNGFAGYFVALGDMMKIDFITRFTTIVTGEPFYQVSINPKKYFTDEVKSLLKGLRVTVVPAGQLSPDGLCNFIDTQVQPAQNVDFLITDYDANFEKTSDSMYAEGDSVYNKLSEISRPRHSPYRTVFVASQPKIQYWGEEELPMECAADSSRKQAIVDLMITIGKAKKVKHCPAGIIKVAKARRGKAGELSRYKVTECGHFVEITADEYAMLQTFEG